jgi:hypothetical protein
MILGAGKVGAPWSRAARSDMVGFSPYRMLQGMSEIDMDLTGGAVEELQIEGAFQYN